MNPFTRLFGSTRPAEPGAVFDQAVAALFDEESTPVSAHNQRETLRIPVGAPCSLRAGRKVAARTLDVSAGGARVSGAIRIATGERIRHVLAFPGVADAVPLDARVIWTRPGTADGETEIGLAFDFVPADVVTSIEELVDRRFLDAYRLSLLVQKGDLITAHRRTQYRDLLRKLGFPTDATAGAVTAWSIEMRELFEVGQARLRARHFSPV